MSHEEFMAQSGERPVEIVELGETEIEEQLFNEFIDGIGSRRYGDATVDQLAADLKERELLPGVDDTRRFLYWAKNFFDAYPDVARIDDLVKIGFTITHAKPLFSLDRETREAITPLLIRDGRMVSTRDLREILAAHGQQKLKDRAEKAVQDYKEAVAEPVEELTPPTDDEPTPAADDDELEPADTPTGDEPATDETPAAPRAERPARARTTPTVRERTVRNPMKILNSVEKSLMKVAAAIPDTFIVLRESAQIGFDSEVAQQKYLTCLRALKAAAQVVMEPLMELVRNVDTEVTAADVPADDGAADA
jgi:hypothetical protein